MMTVSTFSYWYLVVMALLQVVSLGMVIARHGQTRQQKHGVGYLIFSSTMTLLAIAAAWFAK